MKNNKKEYFIYLKYNGDTVNLSFLPEQNKLKRVILSVILKLLKIKSEPALYIGKVIDEGLKA